MTFVLLTTVRARLLVLLRQTREKPLQATVCIPLSFGAGETNCSQGNYNLDVNSNTSNICNYLGWYNKYK